MRLGACGPGRVRRALTFLSSTTHHPPPDALNSARHIADRIRLMVATKQFQVGEALPSTRVLGKQLGASFHTVRKAYQSLTAEGILMAEAGRGFIVRNQTSGLDKSARLDKGAEKIRALLEELIGYGLDEDEIETLFEEQLTYLEWPDRMESTATVGPTREIAAMLARAIRRQVGVKSHILTTADTDRAVQYDALFLPIRHLRGFKDGIDSIPLIPVVYGFDAGVLMTVVERSAVRSLGLIASDAASIPVLTQELQQALGYDGTILAGLASGRTLPAFVKDVDLVLYTFETKGQVENALPEHSRLLLQYQLSETSCDVIRNELWEQ